MTCAARRRGQSATEYMLVLSVIVTSVVAAGYIFVPSFQQGVGALAVDVSQALATGDVGGVGFDRSRGFPGVAPGPVGAGSQSVGAPLGSLPDAQNSTDSGGNGKGGYQRGNQTIFDNSTDPLVRDKADIHPTGRTTGAPSTVDVSGATDG